MKNTLSMQWAELNNALNDFKKSLLEALWVIRFLKYIHSDEFKFFWIVQVRRSIMHFFAYKICRMKEWSKPPRAVRFLKRILYPLHMLYENWNWMSYSPITDQYTVEWMLIDANFFREYKEDKKTEYFRLIRQDERVYIKNLNDVELLQELMPNPIVKLMKEEKMNDNLLKWDWTYKD